LSSPAIADLFGDYTVMKYHVKNVSVLFKI